MPKPNITASDRAEAALAFHRQHAALHGDAETILWHLVADLIEWCDEQRPRVAFDEIVEDARQHLRSQA